MQLVREREVSQGGQNKLKTVTETPKTAKQSQNGRRIVAATIL